MHLEIIDKGRIELLNKLKKIEGIEKFVLGGGTGLSLQYGFRSSIDFDFFCNEHFNAEILLIKLNDEFNNKVEVITKEDRLSTLDLLINNIKVSFFEYSRPILKPLVGLDNFYPIKLLDIYDIAAMKVIEIIQRGTKKDFYDLYCIIKTLNLKSKDLIEILIKKYNDLNVITNLIYSIVYFEEADKENLPKTFVNHRWTEIKKFFSNFQYDLVKDSKNIKQKL